MLEARRDDALSVRDFRAAGMLEKLVDGTVRRLTALLTEHRLACTVGRRTVNVVAVQQAGSVNVIAGTMERNSALP